AQIVELSELFFADGLEYNEEEKGILAEEQVPEVLNAFYNELSGLEGYTPEAIKTSLKVVQKNTGHKGKKLFMPVRVAATGSIHGPDLARTLFLLGKEKVLQRIENVVQ
ncbi:MAG TPA: glutamate--tRNA ligase, partial [Paenibacillaceae bacterium]|nr:glutamate--tRNA ligase [Paenibacillaceae bacterium]